MVQSCLSSRWSLARSHSPCPAPLRGGGAPTMHIRCEIPWQQNLETRFKSRKEQISSLQESFLPPLFLRVDQLGAALNRDAHGKTPSRAAPLTGSPGLLVLPSCLLIQNVYMLICMGGSRGPCCHLRCCCPFAVTPKYGEGNCSLA